MTRNRAERRGKRNAQITYRGVPYLIFAALAAGFLLGTPQYVATSSIAQTGRTTVCWVRRRPFVIPLIGNIGKTNSVQSSIFTENDFTYSGTSAWVDDGALGFRLKFLTSGTFIPLKNLIIDLFGVGGGGGGRSSTSQYGRGGGGGGRTLTQLSITLIAGTEYPIVIGDGGAANSNGGSTSAFGYEAIGGSASPSGYGGGDGASGGGAAGTSTGYNGGAGGSDGSDGTTNGSYQGGVGQHTTTREFGEAGAPLYGGGGGGGAYDRSGAVGGAGGDGGGGAGGGNGTNGSAGTANTGGGGGGAGGAYNGRVGGSGGSGIAIIRNHRAA